MEWNVENCRVRIVHTKDRNFDALNRYYTTFHCIPFGRNSENLNVSCRVWCWEGIWTPIIWMMFSSGQTFIFVNPSEKFKRDKSRIPGYQDLVRAAFKFYISAVFWLCHFCPTVRSFHSDSWFSLNQRSWECLCFGFWYKADDSSDRNMSGARAKIRY